MTTGERIKSLRIAKGLSQEELGTLIGVKNAAIYKYENGLVVNLKRSIIAKLADALETTPAYLMGWDDDSDETTKNATGQDGRPQLDTQLMELLHLLTVDQKKFLLAQIKILLETQ
jgi:transcriptional regulator with XRE-family HTH domain